MGPKVPDRTAHCPSDFSGLTDFINQSPSAPRPWNQMPRTLTGCRMVWRSIFPIERPNPLPGADDLRRPPRRQPQQPADIAILQHPQRTIGSPPYSWSKWCRCDSRSGDRGTPRSPWIAFADRDRLGRQQGRGQCLVEAAVHAAKVNVETHADMAVHELRVPLGMKGQEVGRHSDLAGGVILAAAHMAQKAVHEAGTGTRRATAPSLSSTELPYPATITWRTSFENDKESGLYRLYALAISSDIAFGPARA